MNEEVARALASLVHGQPVAALGTLHQGAPFVSLVVAAVTPDGGAFLVLVSGLAAHTRDMRADPRVSLMITGEPGSGPPQATPRVTFVGEARAIPRGAAEEEAAREAYLGRFPEAGGLFALGDFSLFEIRPRSARFVAGFAQAFSLDAAAVAAALRR